MIYAAWMLLLVILTVAFNGYLEKQKNPNQSVVSNVNGEGISEVVLKRSRSGHYMANGFINGYDATFLLDTGATLVTIPEHLANRMNLTKGRRLPVQTANGVITVYRTMLDSVRLGAIELYRVDANINPRTNSNEILLGMSFMKHLDILQRGDELILRIP